MTNSNENLPVVESSKRDFTKEVTTALSGAWFQTKRTGADSVVLAAETTELTLKAGATVVEGGIVLVRVAKEILPENLEELVADANAFFAGSKDVGAAAVEAAKNAVSQEEKKEV